MQGCNEGITIEVKETHSKFGKANIKNDRRIENIKPNLNSILLLSNAMTSGKFNNERHVGEKERDPKQICEEHHSCREEQRM